MNVFFQGAHWNLAERYTDMVRCKTHDTAGINDDDVVISKLFACTAVSGVGSSLLCLPFVRPGKEAKSFSREDTSGEAKAILSIEETRRL